MTIRDGFGLVEHGGLLVWQTPQFGEDDAVLQLFTTRLGGASRPPYHSLNLSFSTQDDPYAIQENRSLVEQTFRTRLTRWADQVHGNEVYAITERPTLESMQEVPEKLEADALVTALPEVPLAIYFADCLPLFLFDPGRRVIALVHAGWRGTVQEVAKKTVEALGDRYGSPPDEILASLGPSIGPCCFEVQAEVLEQFQQAFHYWPQIVKWTKQHSYVDLWQANFLQLREIGVPPDNVYMSQLCTSCHFDLFYSHRRDRGTTGRMAGVVMLRESGSKGEEVGASV